MQKKYYAAAVFAILLATGCASYGALEDDYGKSYNMAKYGQILNLQASKNLEPVTGLPDKAADANMQKYIKSFGQASAGQGQPSFAVPLMSTGTAGTGQDVYGK